MRERNPSGRRRHLTILAALAVLAGCVRVDSAGDATLLEPGSTFAWAEPPAAAGSPSLGAPESDIRSETGKRLERLGFRAAAREEASILVTTAVAVDQEFRESDPYYYLPAAEKWEYGTLTLEFLDAKSGQRVWQGRSQKKIRCLSRTVGSEQPVLVPTAEERVWPVAAMVDEILSRLPVN